MLKNNFIAALFLFVSANLLLGCQQESAPPATETKAEPTSAPVQAPHQQSTTPLASQSVSGATTGTVISTINAAGYTYVQVNTGREEVWLAGPNTVVTKGGELNVNTSVAMRNFHSKTLNRDFPVLYFVDSFSGSAVQGGAVAPETSVKDWSFGDKPQKSVGQAMPSESGSPTKLMTKVDGGYSIAEVIAQKVELSGKVVKVRGKVTKFTSGIMRKNWIHMEDGSGTNELIVLTNDVVSAGQTIVIEGTVALDRDFGYGYFYALLVEESKVTVEK
ncbi:MAG: hypothetical protein OEL79_05210 [Chromatiales bacterium]|nr:hypothetical protein [Chromatiales bacterium]